MIRKLVLVALATTLFITAPVLLTAATAPGPVDGTGTAAYAYPEVQSAVQPAPEPSYPAWLFEVDRQPNWQVLQTCWIDRFAGQAQRQAIYQRQLADGIRGPGRCPAGEMTIWCDWRLAYPDRYWVEQGCGRIAGWGQNFGAHWSQGWGDHPAKDWVARLRAGGQP